MKKFIFFFIFFLNISFVKAETNIAFIDMHFILKQSLVGKSFEKQIKSYADKEVSILKKREDEIMIKEKQMLSQKNIIKKEEFDKNIIDLQNEIKIFRLDRKKFDQSINNKRLKYTQDIVKILNPIIGKYVEDNSISLVLDKKTILIGKKDLDITNEIVKFLNEKIIDIKDLNEKN